MTKSSKPNIKQLEAKFADTAFRLSQERNDFLLPQILDLVKKEKWINLRPEYQRRQVWDDTKRSLFLESLLLNIPIPPLFLYEWDLSRYEVMDGQQRLGAVVDFYDNAFALKGLERWRELNGFRYRELPDTLKRGLDRRRLSATVLLLGSTQSSTPQMNDVRRLVFERLNTGGMQLNSQELRNCFFAGDFNNLLIRLSHKRLFCSIWDIPPYEDNVDAKGLVSESLRNDRLYRRMLDCEIVLRYFAFRKRSNIRGSVRSMLDRCMKEGLTLKQEDLGTLEKEFTERLDLSHYIFGAHTFRYRDENGSWKLSQPLFDAVMIAFDHLWTKRDQLKVRKTRLVSALQRLLSNETVFEVIVGKPNTAKAVARRIDLISKSFARALKS